MEKVKGFLGYLKETDTKVLNHDDFLDELKNTPERGITGTLKTNMLTPKKGLISIDTFLNNLFTYGGQGHFLSNSEIKELENDNTNYVYDDERYTPNNGGRFLAHGTHIRLFVNDDNDNCLVFLQVHTGAIEPWDFSSYIAIKFNTKMDYEYTFLDRGIKYMLASCLAKTEEGTTLHIEVTSSPLDYTADMFVMDEKFMVDLFDIPIDGSDFDTIKNRVNEYLKTDKELSKEYHVKEFTNYKGTVGLC